MNRTLSRLPTWMHPSCLGSGESHEARTRNMKLSSGVYNRKSFQNNICGNFYVITVGGIIEGMQC